MWEGEHQFLVHASEVFNIKHAKNPERAKNIDKNHNTSPLIKGTEKYGFRKIEYDESREAYVILLTN